MNKLRRVERPKDYNDNIIITWAISNICNYNCSYCDQQSGTFKFPTTIDPIVDFLQSVKEKYPDKNIILILLGGEPTLWKHLITFAEKCMRLNVMTNLNTNGNKSVEWWKENAEKFDKISLTYHPSKMTKRELFDVVEAITEQDIRNNLFLLMMMERKYFESNYNLAKLIADKYRHISIMLKPIRNIETNVLLPYSCEQKQMMNEKIKSDDFFDEPIKDTSLVQIKDNDGKVEIIDRQYLIVNGLNRWSRWKCNAGIETFCVKLNGDVWGCTKRAGDKLGNIYEGDITLPNEPTICNKMLCTCGHDMSVTKYKGE